MSVFFCRKEVNMAKFLVTYDLKTPGQNYSNLYRAIMNLGDWRHGMQNTWFVETSLSANAVLNQLIPYADANDILFVVQVENWWSLRLPEAQWLKGEE